MATEREDFILRELCNLLEALDDETEQQWLRALDDDGDAPKTDPVLVMLLEVARDRRESGAIDDPPLEKLLRARVERAHPERRRDAKPDMRKLVAQLRHAVGHALQSLATTRPGDGAKRMVAVRSAEFTIRAAAAQLDLNFKVLVERNRKGRAHASARRIVRSKNYWDELLQLLSVSDPSVDEVVKLVLRASGFSAEEARDFMRPTRAKN